MSRLLCCLCARRSDMGAALSNPQEGDACEGAGVPAAPPTMADVIRERKKKAGGAGLGTLRRRIAAAARRPRDHRPDRGCEHARFIRSVVSSWRLAEVFLLCEELEAGAALRDLATQADLAREPANVLTADLALAYRDRWWCDVELVGGGWSIPAHRAILAARCTYFRDLLNRYPPSCCRVPLDGVCSTLTYEELEACVCALYAGTSMAGARNNCSLCNKWERGANNDGDLDIINVENSNSCRNGSMCRCAPSSRETSAVSRLAPLLGFSVVSLHHDMRYLLDSGEMCDARLVFRLEGGCSSYGFHSALELPCHRVVLAARSRFFRSVMSRRSSGCLPISGSPLTGPGVALVTVDEQVLPRRFARALLHAAYTDQVDLTLVSNHSPTPTSTPNNQGGVSTGWPGVARSSGTGSRPTTTAALDDAFQLYEIARFLEMAIVVQGCEDAIVEALSPETLPHVLRWAAAPHASHWVHRQAMRYLRDEFPAIMAAAASARLPRSAVADALGSPFLQASEPQALRALLRWGTHQPHHQREPNVVWHTGHSGSRRGARRREASDAALREALASLVALVRIEHVPPDNELLNQLIRRGIVCASMRGAAANTADAWLARGNYRPPRCFLPYLDEIKALLEDQAVPEAEVSRVRRARYLHRIPDTLYMVAAARNNSANECPSGGAANPAPSALESACVSPRVLGQLRARVRELRQAPPALTALALHHSDKTIVYRQIALRAVREMSLPDACAELLLTDIDGDRERPEDWESPQAERRRGNERSDRGDTSWNDVETTGECCRTGSSSGSLRCPSAGSLRANTLHIPMESSRSGTCRRELPSRSVETTRHRQSVSDCAGAASVSSGLPLGVGQSRVGRLSAAVPDVAMAPNANTHLLTNRDYFRHPLTADYSGVVLQLDLGDGATHTPRPGSRAQRANAAAHSSRQREHAQAMSCLRTRPDDDELRAAIELSVIRAYSSFHPRAPFPPLQPSPSAQQAQPSSGAQAQLAECAVQPQPQQSSRCRAMPSTLPHSYRQELHPLHHSGVVGRSSASPVPLGGGVAQGGSTRQHELHTPPPHHYSLSRVSSADRSERAAVGGGGSGSAAAGESRSPTPSPRRLRHHEYAVYRHHDYRVDNVGGAGVSGVRGSSPGGGYA